jgi:hypothetical protein
MQTYEQKLKLSLVVATYKAPRHEDVWVVEV